MLLRSAVVVVVDRLGAGFLGPYGSTWLDTPALNCLASRSLLVETVIADSPNLGDVYRSYWTGRHALADPLLPAPTASIVGELATLNVKTVLVTDEPQVAEHPWAAAFERAVLVPSVPVEKCAAEAADTGIARLFVAAADTLAALSPPFLLWVHCRGMAGSWDAPLEFREQFRDEEDPLPGDLAAPPEQRIGKDFDPDELLKLSHAYAGQVSLLDVQLSGFLEVIQSRSQAETLLAFTSPRGYPLGEHGRIGPCDGALYAELLQVPLLVKFPQQQGALLRSDQILQPADLGAAVAEHFGLPLAVPGVLFQISRNEHHPPREAALAVGESQWAIRTPAWYLREFIVDQEVRHELFAKPDDRWEVNEVSSRCGAELDLLIAMLDRLKQVARGGMLTGIAPLPEILRDTWR